MVYAISCDWFQHTTTCSSYGLWYTVAGPNTELLTGCVQAWRGGRFLTPHFNARILKDYRRRLAKTKNMVPSNRED